MKQIRSKLTYANVMVTILAVFVVGGGGAYAATHGLPKNSVGTKQLKKGAVSLEKIQQRVQTALTGPAGAKGTKGDRGEKGVKGDKGEPGGRGEAGEKGERGPSAGFATYLSDDIPFTEEDQVVARLTLPPGLFISTAWLRVGLGPTGSGTLVHCNLFFGPTKIAGTDLVEVPAGSQILTLSSGGGIGAAGGEAQLRCSGGNKVRISDRGMTAVQVQSIGLN